MIMQCPMCSHERGKVLETRACEEGVYRRHRCYQCEHVYVSLETLLPGAKGIPKHVAHLIEAARANRTA